MHPGVRFLVASLVPLAALVGLPAAVAFADTVTAGDYGRYGCGVKSDGTLACWGQVPGLVQDPLAPGGVTWGMVAPTPPGGTFTAVSASADSYAICGLKSDHTLACWGGRDSLVLSENQKTGVPPHVEQYPGLTPQPDGTFIAVSVGLNVACAIRTDGTLACWGALTPPMAVVDFRPPSGTFTAVSVADNAACAIRTDGTYACWGQPLGAAEVPTPPGVTLTAVSSTTGYNCGIRTDGTLTCWGVPSALGEHANAPDGTFSAVAVADRFDCGVRTDGSLACWGFRPWVDGSRTGSDVWQQCRPDPSRSDPIRRDPTCGVPSGAFVTVSPGWFQSVALRTDGTLAAWTGFVSPDDFVSPPPSDTTFMLPATTARSTPPGAVSPSVAGAAKPSEPVAVKPAAPDLSASAYRAPGQTPRFAAWVTVMQDELGDTLGLPVECEHPNPPFGDYVQKTTTGLAVYLFGATPTFTDGSTHWAVTPDGLVSWTEDTLQPPAETEPPD